MQAAALPQETLPKLGVGAATVTRRLGPQRLELELEDGQIVEGRIAIGVPYQPLRGDEVVVVGAGKERFVIGLTEGRGRIALRAQRLTLAARGRLRLAAKRVRLEAPRVDFHVAGRLRQRVAEAMVDVGELEQHVVGMLGLVTRHADLQVLGTWYGQAKRVVWKVKDVFHINGETVRLG